MDPDAPLDLSMLRSHFGRAVHIVELPGGATSARTWMIRDDGSAPLAFIKVHETPRKSRQERTGFDLWSGTEGIRCPQLLHLSDDPRVIGMTPLSGTRVADEPTLLHDPEVHATAASVLRKLQAVTPTAEHFEEDPVPLETALARRFRSWCEQSREAVPEAVLRSAAGTFDPRLFRDEKRRPCHRDFQPGNWFWDSTLSGTERLGIFDFEHSRPDHPLVDHVKSLDLWERHPRLERAFTEAWGSVDPARETLLRLQLGILHGLATAAWGHRNGDTLFHEHGLHALDVVLARLS